MNYGHLEVICGPMYSGKTETLIRMVRGCNGTSMVFKPSVDTRSDSCVRSHSAMEYPAMDVHTDSPGNILLNSRSVDSIFIEEAQFFSNDLVHVVDILLGQGKHVVVVGLDMDSWARPFGCLGHLMAVADRVTKLKSRCSICGSPASMSFKKTGDSGLVDIGAGDKYEPRCRLHFSLPAGRPA